MAQTQEHTRSWPSLAPPLSPSCPCCAPGPASRSRRAAAEESAELTAAFARAADAIRRHQSSEGYWKTPVTAGPVFERQTTELNVFTPAVMIDVLDPVARETGLTDVLARARGYLRRRDRADRAGAIPRRPGQARCRSAGLLPSPRRR